MGMRAVIELKKDADVERTLAALYKYSELQDTVGVNMVAIADGKPMQMGLKTILAHYIRHQKEVVTRRTRYDLEQAKARAHILEGLIIAVDNLDEVIRLIRASKTPKEARERLIAAFNLTEIQAQAILDMRLQRLTNLEILTLRNEYAEVLKRIKYLESILKSEKKLISVIRDGDSGEVRRRAPHAAGRRLRGSRDRAGRAGGGRGGRLHDASGLRQAHAAKAVREIRAERRGSGGAAVPLCLRNDG